MATFFVVGLAALMPASAGAGSLLSGYGAPGAGSQAILGAVLVGGRSGPGGSGGGGSDGGSGAGASLKLETAAAERSQSAAATGPSRPALHAVRERAVSGETSGSGSQPYAHTGLTASQAGVGGGPAFGLTGGDVVYIILALGALVLTGVLTRSVARQPG